MSDIRFFFLNGEVVFFQYGWSIILYVLSVRCDKDGRCGREVAEEQTVIVVLDCFTFTNFGQRKRLYPKLPPTQYIVHGLGQPGAHWHQAAHTDFESPAVLF